jgi:hypothetical protein
MVAKFAITLSGICVALQDFTDAMFYIGQSCKAPKVATVTSVALINRFLLSTLCQGGVSDPAKAYAVSLHRYHTCQEGNQQTEGEVKELQIASNPRL